MKLLTFLEKLQNIYFLFRLKLNMASTTLPKNNTSYLEMQLVTSCWFVCEQITIVVIPKKGKHTVKGLCPPNNLFPLLISLPNVFKMLHVKINMSTDRIVL